MRRVGLLISGTRIFSYFSVWLISLFDESVLQEALKVADSLVYLSYS